nr:EOG090X0DPX [Eulimnadia texana]
MMITLNNKTDKPDNNWTIGARKYGTVGPSIMKTQYTSNYVQHRVQTGDTLQGIALRYGTSMELIKRTNKLWNAEMLHLREVLYVPVAAEQGGEASTAEIRPLENSLSSSLSTSDDNAASNSNEKSLNDILSDIDSRIDQAKRVAKSLQENSHVAKSCDFEICEAPRMRTRFLNRGRHSFPEVHARYLSPGEGDAPTIVILPDSRVTQRSLNLNREPNEGFGLSNSIL